jgi:hypothetical protein
MAVSEENSGRLDQERPPLHISWISIVAISAPGNLLRAPPGFMPGRLEECLLYDERRTNSFKSGRDQLLLPGV